MDGAGANARICQFSLNPGGSVLVASTSMPIMPGDDTVAETTRFVNVELSDRLLLALHESDVAPPTNVNVAVDEH